MKILLAHSNFLINDPKQTRKMRPYPPLATLYAAAMLRDSGHDVALFDPTFKKSLGDFDALLKQFKPDLLIVYEDLFNFITKMCLSHMRQAACKMVELAKSTNIPAIAAGPDASDHPDAFLCGGFDYVLSAEPDHTLIAVVDILSGSSNTPISDVPGVVYRTEDDRIHSTATRSPEKNPDIFPLPAWDLVNMDDYRRAWRETHGYFSLNLASSRGCPYSCTWCAKPIWNTRYSQQSPERVADEIAHLKQVYQPDHIWFADDIFGHNVKWLKAFEYAIRERSALLPYTIQTRVDLVPEDAITLLRQSGCREVWMGVESGSQKVLDAMNKGYELESAFDAVRGLKTAGIRACIFIQFGYPDENYEDIQ